MYPDGGVRSVGSYWREVGWAVSLWLLSGAAGWGVPELERLAGVVVWLVSERVGGEEKRGWLKEALVGVVALVGRHPLFSLIVLVGGRLWEEGRVRGSTWLFLGWQSLHYMVPEWWYVENGGARLCSWVVGSLTGLSTSWGWEWWGASALLLWWGMVPLREVRERLGWYLGVVLLWLGWACLWRGYMETWWQEGGPVYLEGLGRGYFYGGAQALLWGVVIGGGYGVFRFWLKDGGEERATGVGGWIGGGVAGIAVLAMLFGLGGTSSRGPVFLFATKHGDLSTVPDEKTYGKAGLFGLLPVYLEDMGYHVEVVGDLRELRGERGMLVMLNPEGRWEEGAEEAVKEFVEEGGGLLFVGDHTRVWGLENEYYDTLASWGIEVCFDSAVPYISGWRRSLWSPDPELHGLVGREDTVTGIVVGASLSLRPPAFPLVVGRYGWKDQGDPGNTEGYLGDMRDAPDEEKGDVVLVAGRQMGRGRIVVCGDTTFFQNSLLPFTYGFVRALLERSGGWRLFPWWMALVWTVVWTGWWIVARRKEVALLVLIAVLGIGGEVVMRVGAVEWFDLPEGEGTRVAIDMRVYPGWDGRVWEARGIAGLFNTLHRAGVVPYVVYEGGHPEQWARMWWILDPGRVLSSGERGVLEGYLEEGGAVLVAAGRESWRNVREVGERWGVEVGERFYGPVVGMWKGGRVRFMSGWGLRAEGGEMVVRAEDGGGLVWMEGRKVWVGDSHFFENRNLEGISWYDPENERFVRFLARELCDED